VSKAVSNTSPLLYLYRAGVLEWLPQIFEEVVTVPAVVAELEEGRRRGYDVPQLSRYRWLKVRAPLSVPSEWFVTDLGSGELETMSLALEYKTWIVLLDDRRAREIAKAAGLNVWGTLRVLIEAKRIGLVEKIAPVVDKLGDSGMWMSKEIRRRILRMADEIE